jgi:hypothetical protein
MREKLATAIRETKRDLSEHDIGRIVDAVLAALERPDAPMIAKGAEAAWYGDEIHARPRVVADLVYRDMIAAAAEAGEDHRPCKERQACCSNPAG